MRSVKQLIMFLCALVAVVAMSAQAADQSKLTSQQQEYLRLLDLEYQNFTSLHPEFRDPAANNPEALDRRRDLALQWQKRARVLRDKVGAGGTNLAGTDSAFEKWQRKALSPRSASMLPNETAAIAGPPDQNNASFAYHDILPTEAYGVWTYHFAMFGTPPTQVWFGGTPVAGSGIPWLASGGINAPVPPVALPESWNPTIAAVPPITVDAYYLALVEWPAPALMPGVPSAIVAHTSAGSGAPFPSGTGPSVVFQAGGASWVDYPYLVVDDHPGNVGPPGRGDVHVAWVEYLDGDGDPNGNGIFYDDPGDIYNMWVASANTGIGPIPYPGWGNYWVLWTAPVMPLMHQTHRPSLSTVGPGGTPLIPPSGAYIAWYDAFGGAILVDASPQPGAGAPWLALGPIIVGVPVTGLPPVLNGNIKSATNVTIAVDNGPLSPGMVYVAWSDFATGDADILFSSSPDGGVSWTPPVRVHQDLPNNGADQWAPHMMVDLVTGDIKITYYDRRTDPANVNIETWASSSLDGGITWNDWIISDAGPTPPITLMPPVPPVGGSIYMGDYLFSDFNPISGWAAIWNDGRNGGDQDVLFENIQTPPAIDSDGDGIVDGTDNCTWVFNPVQAITIVLTGDCDLSTTLTSADIIILVNFTFKGGPPPLPCPATGDVNCDGANTSADIIYMVNHVFKGGPAPCNVCLAPGLGWTCP